MFLALVVPLAGIWSFGVTAEKPAPQPAPAPKPVLQVVEQACPT